MYELFYGLKAKPFQLTPDPRFFFRSKVHKRALAYLRYGINQGEGFIVITGGVGTGKSMLVETLFAGLSSRDNVVAAYVVTSQLEADDLLRMVAASFGVPHENISKANLLMKLTAFFSGRLAEGRRVLIVVDEAQNMPRRALEELRMLSNLHQGGKALVQGFLLGQDEFRYTMQSKEMEQVRQRVSASYHLSPLDEAETREYIEHRLTMAGWRSDPALSDEAFPLIYEFTGGVPRRINTFCDRLMLYGFLEEKHALVEQDVTIVRDELREEQSDGDVARPVQSLGDGELLATNRWSIESRVTALEQEVEALRQAFARERELMRRALLERASDK